MRSVPPLTALISTALLVFPLVFAQMSNDRAFWFMLTEGCVLAAAVAWRVESGQWHGLRPGGHCWVAEAGWGLLSAGLLYAVFRMAVAGMVRFWPGGLRWVTAVYDLRAGVNEVALTAALVLVIAPCEEWFWRAALQSRLVERWGLCTGWAGAAALYAAVHAPSGNPLLVLAAAFCGLYWGAWWAWRRSMIANAVSHAAWDVAVFVVAPLIGPV